MEGKENCWENLSQSPEWASLRISRGGSALYIIAIIVGTGLCIGTLSVLLS
ncbi:MAG: hypothetical protein IJG54_01450 [Bacteroidales bacterium]|nr:hypothetical protein [Bacteroidales bacterium]